MGLEGGRGEDQGEETMVREVGETGRREIMVGAGLEGGGVRRDRTEVGVGLEGGGGARGERGSRWEWG